MLRRQHLHAANTIHPCVRTHDPGVRSRAISRALSSIWREPTASHPSLNKNLILFNHKWSGSAADGRGAKPQGRRVCGSLRFPAVEPCFVRVLPRFRRACFARASAPTAVVRFARFPRLRSVILHVPGGPAIPVIFRAHGSSARRIGFCACGICPMCASRKQTAAFRAAAQRRTGRFRLPGGAAGV